LGFFGGLLGGCPFGLPTFSLSAFTFFPLFTSLLARLTLCFQLGLISPFGFLISLNNIVLMAGEALRPPYLPDAPVNGASLFTLPESLIVDKLLFLYD